MQNLTALLERKGWNVDGFATGMAGGLDDLLLEEFEARFSTPRKLAATLAMPVDQINGSTFSWVS